MVHWIQMVNGFPFSSSGKVRVNVFKEIKQRLENMTKKTCRQIRKKNQIEFLETRKHNIKI